MSTVADNLASIPHGFADDERSRVLRARLPAEALAWVEEVVGGRVTRAMALKGGSSSAIHAVRVRRGTAGRTIVLRRYVLPEVLDEEPGIVGREARVLELLHGAGLAAPRLIAAEPSGRHAGVPALLMSRVPGRLNWTPAEVAPWLGELTAVLPSWHDIRLPPGHGIGAFRPYPPERWEAPPWLRRPGLWDRALAVFHGQPLDTERTLIHRDYHPGNVLWRAGRVSGVVDWQAACIGPPSADVAWCRLNIIGRCGLDAADRLITRWEQTSGRTYHPWSEIVLLIDVLGWPETPKAQERDDLEQTLARRLSEL